MSMHVHEVKSSAIASLGYDAGTRTMAVTFKGGKRYEYDDVPPEVFEHAKGAESVGKYVSAHVVGKFKHRAT